MKFATPLPLLAAAFLVLGACGDDGRATATEVTTTPATATTTMTTGATPGTTGEPGTGSESDSDTAVPTTGTTASEPTTTTTSTTGTTEPAQTSSTTAGGCGACDQPNQQCVDGVCVTSCQGQGPDACPQGQVCDVISGECHAEGDPCTLAGLGTPCADLSCGPGTTCDGLGACVPVAPCADVACTDDGQCWGAVCGCERVVECQEPTADLLNGPFSTEIGGIDFADDCNAWMVTLRSGPDYVRRLKPDGELTQWTGVANLNMGEVKVLRRLTIPQLTDIPPVAAEPSPPTPVEGLGEVAITYTCCQQCGCQADPPQGVARLDEDNVMSPLPIVIVAQVTQGDGPFGSAAADAGPHGLAWGEDRVLYVGNSTMNGEYNNADLDNATQGVVFTFDARVTASAPISPVHLLVALDGGAVYRFNNQTKQAEFVVDLMSDVTSLAHDAFTGHVYAGLASLEVVRVAPFTGEVEPFQTMPGVGRVAVSPSGKLWYTPVKYLADVPLQSWDLPMAF
ncbi:hypothetical protein [Nannocystis punicea]|uniref:Uncharacterized protein n=1 Tax=Nannocystis punicea TaxID=2995304 RepID=A0ABY7HIL4_9BACT|nr:hypothetical protein [Nannocystis poenicansa]WAS99176.1 hypothetical protein O0S08_23865 [Nannocystis poenicansa]